MAAPDPPLRVPWTPAGADTPSLIRGLTHIYWAGVELELRIMILALAELMAVCPEEIAVEAIPYKPHPKRMEYFAGRWAKVDLTAAEHERVRETFRRASKDSHSRPLIERRAKQLIQGAGWLDIDFVHNDRPLQYPSMAGRPKVASIDNDSVLQALQCSICRKCIRSPFFECTEGCLDLESPKNHYKCTPNPTNPSANITHLIPRLQPTPFRSCSTCTTTTTTANAAPASPPPHPRAHLKITSSTSDYDSPRAACVAFSRELDALEDLASGRAGAIASLAAMVAMRVTRGGVRRRFLPAGNVHLAYRFGTLVVESGVPHSQGGVLATTREPQQLLFTPYTQHTSMLTGENDIPLTHTPKLALSPSRHVFTKPQDPRDAARRVLAVVKQVCANPLGGGGVHETDDMDTTLPLPLPALLAAAATAYATHNPLLPLATKRAALNASAGEMLRVVKRLIGGDVESQIRVISETLMMVRKGGGGGGVDLTWHPLHNNCQRFCNALLHAERDFCTAEYMEGSPSPRHYTHSFAGATTFPLAHKSGDLRRSEDLPAYLTTLHPTTSLLTFSLTRKLWRGPELANMALDPTLFVSCGMACHHVTSEFESVRRRTDEVIRLCDHVLGDPFSGVAVLAGHLERGWEGGMDGGGRLWGGAGVRRMWCESRIRAVVGMDVFLSFAGVVAGVSDQLLREGGGERKVVARPSGGCGRAVMERGLLVPGGDKAEPVNLWDNPGMDMWEMQPTRLPSGVVRKRVACIRVWRSGGGREERRTWRRCKCEYCVLSDEEVEAARRA